MTARAETELTPSASEVLRRATQTDNFTLGRPFQVRPLPDGRTVLYLKSPPDGRKADLMAFDLETKKESVLLSAQDLLGGDEEDLSPAEKARRERQRIKTAGFVSFAVSENGKRILTKLSGRLYLYDREQKVAAPLDLPEGNLIDPRLSPDGRWVGFVRDHDLFAAKISGPIRANRPVRVQVQRLTKGGNERVTYGLAEFVAQEEMGRMHGYWWSRDSRRLVYQVTDHRPVESFTIADAAHPERAPLTFPYPRPGKNNVKVRLEAIDRDGKNRQRIDWDTKAYPYLARVQWGPKGRLAILVQSRDQHRQAFLRVRKDGLTVPMHEETDSTWLNLRSSTPRWLPSGDGYLYATEEGGGWQLELHRPKKGKSGGLAERRVVVPASAGFEELLHVDESGQVFFSGGEDPTQLHVFRTRIQPGTKIRRLTESNGMHHAVFSEDGRLMAVTETSLSDMPRTSVTRLNDRGRPGRAVEIPSDAAAPPFLPRIELVPPERAGGFHAMLVRPRNFEPERKYPVILYVYGGPHVNVVTRAAHRYFLQQYMADNGFVVVSLDGRGTPRRGRDFERAVDQRFHDVPLTDQVQGLEALAARHSELDLDRVGVYGWSFGGYMAALAVLERPDLFKVGVAGAPVTDWLYYDTHYTERYLGVPSEDAEPYRASSLVAKADQLQRPLLLIHGIADDNVYFAHTLLLADALFAAGKDFDLLPLVGLTHQVANPDVRLTLYERILRHIQNGLASSEG